MNYINFIDNRITNFSQRLNLITTKIDSNQSTEEDIPKVEILEEVLDKITRLTKQMMRYQVNDSKIANLHALQNEYKKTYNYLLGNEINGLSVRYSACIRLIQQTGNNISHPQNELLSLLHRVRILSLKANLTHNQTNRLNEIEAALKTNKYLIQTKNPETSYPCSLDVFPIEILTHFCSFLSLYDLGWLSQCNKFFKNLCDNLRKEVGQKYVKKQHFYRHLQSIEKGFYTVETLKGHEANVCDFRIMGNLLISGFNDGSIKIFDLKIKKFMIEIEGVQKKNTFFTQPSLNYNFQIQNNFLYSTTENSIHIWDLNTKKCVAQLNDHTGYITAIQLKGDTLYSASWDKTIRIWNINSGQCIAILEESGPVVCLKIKDNLLFSATRKGMIKVWDLITRQCINTRPMPSIRQFKEPHVCSLEVGDSLLYIGLSNGDIEIWDPKFKLCRILHAKEGSSAVTCLKGIGTFLFSARMSMQKTSRINIWNRIKESSGIDGKYLLLRNLNGLEPNKGIQYLEIKGSFLFSASRGGAIKVWNFNKSALEFLSKIPNQASEYFERLPVKIQNDVSEEIYIYLALNKDWIAMTHEERALAIHRYLLKQVLNALNLKKTSKALSIFFLLPEKLRNYLFNPAEVVFSKEKVSTSIQGYLNDTMK